MLFMTDVLGADSEVGRLRTVILHRPGLELRRLTPRNNDALLFDGLPWVARAQEEHDAFAGLLRSRGVEVLLVGDLLATALESGAARIQGIAAAVDSRRLGIPLARELTGEAFGELRAQRRILDMVRRRCDRCGQTHDQFSARPFGATPFR